jgi:predicted AlkP superfamily pyrophosphatase or phosphodiesterase
MISKILTLLLSVCLAWPAENGVPRHQEIPRPKLILAIVVDQFRYDYLNRWRTKYTGGFARFYQHGAVFTNAHHEHFPTVTAVGHSAFMTGATPATSGIVNNSWYDRATGKDVTSVSDDSTQLLGAPGPGSSPHRLVVSTLADELKMSGRQCRVIGISIKDRAAILPVGHMADGAYWFDSRTGNFVSSTFYFADLPGWVKDYNAKRPADKYLNAEWRSLEDNATLFRKNAATADARYYSGMEATPFGNEMIEEFAERAVDAEQLGQHPDIDVLTVSFSSNDYVGHALGPDSPEVRDISLRVDLVIEKLLKFLDQKVGRDHVLVAMTADHGVSPVPELQKERKMPGGRFDVAALFETLQQALTSKYGEGKWVVGKAGPVAYLNFDLIHQKNLNPGDVERTAADAWRALPNVFRVYTREQLLLGQTPEDKFSIRVRNGFYPSRSGDIFLIPDAYWIFESHGTSHGTLFNYDTHVPLMLMGPGVNPGIYDEAVAVEDLAPTLATMLEVEIPSGSIGRVLTEVFGKRSLAP